MTTPKLNGAELIEQGYGATLDGSHRLRLPSGAYFDRFDTITVQGGRYRAYQVAEAILDHLQAELEREIQADRKRALADRKRTGTRGGPAGDRLNLIGAELTTKPQKF